MNPTIPTTPVESSQFAAYGYDGLTLQIDFHPRKRDGVSTRYQYANVTPEQWEEFQSAESKGSWFIHNIKARADRHPYARIADLVPEEVAAGA